MSGIRDTATVTLNVNGAQAKQMMADVEAKIKQTRATIANLQQSMADPKDIEKAKKQLKTYQKQLEEMESATKGVDRALSNINLATPRQLEKALKTLNRQFKDMEPGSAVWDSHCAKIRELNSRLAELRGAVNEQESLWNQFREWSVSAWPAFDLLKGWRNDIVSELSEYVDAFATMDQEMANVRKFTGMTEEQVASLNERFKEIDTRSPREELNKLAQEAGRLGKTSEEDVLGFVRAADKINVALDDLGEGATLKLSKLTGIFGDEDRYGTEQSLLRVGSVINELSQNCSASAPYIAEFAERMGGVGAQAGMKIQQIMGFAAVLDSNAQKVEASATALSQVIVRLYQDPAKYAKVAGLDVKEFSKLMREDANAAIILFLDTLSKAGGMDTLSPMFKDMGENGSRAIQALSTLATHIEDVKSQQQAANVAFEEGTSIDIEFAVQNETVEASLDKCKNAANELRVELGQYLYPLMGKLLKTSTTVVRSLVVAARFTIEHRDAIISLSAGIAAYTVAVNLATIKQAAHTAAMVASSVAAKALYSGKLLLATVTALLTGNIGRATAAMSMFNATMRLNPIGLVVGAVTAAISAFTLWRSKAREAAEEEKRIAEERKKNMDEYRKSLNDITAATESSSKAEITELRKLYTEATNVHRAYDKRIASAKELQKIFPVTFGNLKAEEIAAGDAADAYLRLADNILQSARAEAARDKIKRNESSKIDLELANEDLEEQIAAKELELDSIEGEIIRQRSRTHTVQEAIDLREKKRRKAAIESELADLDMQKAINNDKIDETRKANERLEKIVEKSEERIEKKREDDKAIPSTSYVSQKETAKKQKEAEKNAKKAAAAEKKALAMERAEIKAALKKAKGEWESDTAENIAAYGQGLRTYEEFLAEKERLDLKYVEDRIAVYGRLYEDESEMNAKLLLLHDEEYQNLLMKRADAVNKNAAAEAKRSVEELKRLYAMAVAAAEFEFSSPGSKYYGDEEAQQARLHELRIKYLTEYKKQYKAGSKEWLDYERQMQEAEQNEILRKRKAMASKFEEFSSAYTSVSAKRRFDIESAMVEKLYKARRISEEQYQIWLAELRKKYRQDEVGAEEAADSARYKVSDPGGKDSDVRSESDLTRKRVSDLDRQRTDAIGELQERFAAGLITEEQLAEGIRKINAAYEESLFDPVRDGLDEQTRMLLDLGLVWSDFFKSISENGELSFTNITDLAKNSVAVMCAGLQTYSQFLEAQSTIDQANVEKRYDREIELAQGNSYKTQQLEKKKEAELQKVKEDASRKEFAVKVIEAVAQTATNALAAYGAGLQAGFPMALWLAPTLAAAAAAQGAVQVALLKKQQQAAAAQGYSEGGFTGPGGKYEPAGIVHKGEWVASQRLLANPVARPMIEALDKAQRTNTIGSLRAEDVSRSITAGQSLVRMGESGDGSLVMAAVATRMSSVVAELTARLNEPFVTVNTVTGDKGIKQAQDEYTRLMNNVTPKSKRK